LHSAALLSNKKNAALYKTERFPADSYPVRTEKHITSYRRCSAAVTEGSSVCLFETDWKNSSGVIDDVFPCGALIDVVLLDAPQQSRS
jgi:hypothetical protein